VTEPTASVVSVESRHLTPHHLDHTLHHELSDAITTCDSVLIMRVGVQENHLDLTSIRAVDETGTVHHAEAVLQSETASRQYETGIPTR